MSLADKSVKEDGVYFWPSEVREAVRELKKKLIEEHGIKYREARNCLTLIDEIFGSELI